MRVVPIVLGAAAVVLLRGMFIDTLNPLLSRIIIHRRRSQALAAEAWATAHPVEAAREASARFAAQTHDAHKQVVPPEH